MGDYTLRAPTSDDVTEVAALIAACQLADRGAAEMTVAELQDEWQGLNLAEDATVVTAPDEQIAGYADIFNRAYVSVPVYGHVHPEHRGRGVGQLLVVWGEMWADKNMVHAPIGANVVVQHYILGSNTSAQALMEQQRYQPVRGVYEMAIDLTQPVPQPIWPDEIVVRNFVPGQDERTTYEAYEEASEDMWQRPRGVFERWIEFTQRSDPTLLFVAEDKNIGEIAGVCVCSLLPSRGHIDGIRVRRAWRRRGLGLALLQHAFGEFYRRGARVVDLSVDAESPTNAPQVYTRAGMHVTHSYIIYQKELHPKGLFSSWRHQGAMLMTSMKGHAELLLAGAAGGLSDTRRNALQVISNNCEPSAESWIAFHDLIRQNPLEEIIQILTHIEDDGQSYLKKHLSDKALTGLEVVRQQLVIIRTEPEELTALQVQLMRPLDRNCEHAIKVWEEVVAYFDREV